MRSLLRRAIFFIRLEGTWEREEGDGRREDGEEGEERKSECECEGEKKTVCEC